MSIPEIQFLNSILNQPKSSYLLIFLNVAHQLSCFKILKKIIKYDKNLEENEENP